MPQVADADAVLFLFLALSSLMDASIESYRTYQEGEVCVSGPNLMQGYHNMPEATEEIFFEKDGERLVKRCESLME